MKRHASVDRRTYKLSKIIVLRETETASMDFSEESKMVDFYCPKTGTPIGWAFDHVPKSLYCYRCKTEHAATDLGEEQYGDEKDLWGGEA
jgi:hypothetical protein